MVTLNVYNRQGESVGTVDVDPAEFGGNVNKQLLHDVVMQYLANQRAGTHSTLRRGEVAGSTKKLFRQKGTGNARAARAAPTSAAAAAPPRARSRATTNTTCRRAVRAATRMAILSKFQDNEAVVIDDLAPGRGEDQAGRGAPQGAEAARGDSDLPGAARTTTTRTYICRRATSRKSRCCRPSQFNAYTVLRQKRLVLTKAALEELRKRQGAKAEAPAARGAK